MYRDGSADRNRGFEDFDETLRMSQSTAASIESTKPIPDIHPYLEIGKSLQNLRRSVFDMYTDEVNKSVRSAERNSPPLATVHHSATNSTNHHHHHESHFESHYRTSQHDSILLTPSAFTENSTGRLASNNNSGAHRTPTSKDRELRNKNRTSTPYRHVKQDSDDFGGSVHKFSASDLNDSREEPLAQNRAERVHIANSTSPPQRPPQHPHQSETYKRHNRSESESFSDEASLQRRRLHSRVEVRPDDDLASHSSTDTGSDSSRDEQAHRRSRDKNSTNASASVEVGHAIAVIVGQHEERFNTLTKEIDFWQRKSTALASQLADHDKSYNTKLEYVLAEQETLSEQQQQVVRELNAALAAHQQALAQVTAAAAQGSPSGEKSPPLPFSPDLFKDSAALLKESVQKLERLTTEISSSATPLKAHLHSLGANAGVPSSATATPHAEAGRHASENGGLSSQALLNALRSPQAGAPIVTSPPEQLSPAQMQLISYQNMQHRQEDMDQMQRLYDNLSAQLRRLFEEKTALMAEMSEMRSVNMDLQQKLRIEGEAHQQAMLEQRAEFEAQVRTAKLLAQEAKEHAAQSRAAEKKLQDTERELNLRVADLETQLSSRMLELTSTRAALSKAQQRVSSLQEEAASAVNSREDNQLELQECKRKLKELNKTTHSREELIASLQREVTELNNKIKKPFTTSVKVMENTDKRINYEYEVSMLKDSVLAIQESEAELQKQYLNLQAESKKEVKRVRDAASQELTKLSAEHEAELDALKKELHQRKRQIEQQSRLRHLAEEELAELRVQHVKLEESVSHYRVEGAELLHGNEQARNQLEELQDKLSAKQTEITKILSQLTRARKRIEKVEGALDEKDKVLTELNQRQVRLQQSIRTHAEREIDHLQALRQLMHSSSLRIADAASDGTAASPLHPALQRLLLKNSSSPASNTSSPSTTATAGALAGQGLLPVSVKGRKLSLPALEAECDALWEDIPNAVETVLHELKQFQGRTATLSSDLKLSRFNSTTMNSELTSHITRQQEEIVALKHEIETRDLNAKKRLEKFKAASQADFTAESERLKGELTNLNAQINSLAAEKSEQIGRLKSERNAVQSELDQVQHALSVATRRSTALQEAQSASDKRHRAAALELIHDVQTLSSIALIDADALGEFATPTGVHDNNNGTRRRNTSSPTSKLTSLAESDLPTEQLVSAAAVVLRAKAKELTKYLKNTKRTNDQQQDALKTFFDTLNAQFVSVDQAHRAHLLHDQLQSSGATETPIKNNINVQKLDLSHLYSFLCENDAELRTMLQNLEEHVHTTLQRCTNVETHLLYKRQQLEEVREELASSQQDLAHEKSQKDVLNQKVARLEASLESQLVEYSHATSVHSEHAQQILQQRDVLELDLTELEEKVQVLSQRNDQLEQSVGNLEDELSGTQQELRDARRTLDEVFSQLQASQGRLGDLQQEVRVGATERENLSQRLVQAQNEHATAQRLLTELQNQHDQQVDELQALHNTHVSEILEKHIQQTDTTIKLRGHIAEHSDQYFQLETEHGRLKLRLAQAEEDNGVVYAELQDTKAQLSETLEDLADAKAQLEIKDEELQQAQQQISELRGDVESRVVTLTQETSQLRVTREQLAQNCTTLATLQITHSTLQKEYDVIVLQAQLHQERANSLETQLSEHTATVETLRLQMVELETRATQSDQSAQAINESNNELRAQVVELNAQLTEFHGLDADFQHVQHELVTVREEYELEITQLVEKHAMDLLQLKDDYEGEVLRVKEECEGELTFFANERDAQLTELKSHHEEQLIQVKEHCEGEIIKLTDRYQAELTVVKQQCEAELHHVTEQLQEMKTHFEAELREEKEQCSIALQQMQSECEEDINRMQAQADAEKFYLTTTHVSEVSCQKQDFQLERTRYEESLKESATRIEQLASEQVVLSKKIAFLTVEAAKWPVLAEEVKLLQGKLREAEDRLLKCADFEHQMNEKESALQKSHEAIKGLQEQLAATQSQLATVSSQLSTTESRCSELEQHCDELGNELQDTKQHLADVQSRLTQQESALVESARHESSSKMSIRSLESERTTLREKLDTLTASCTDLQIDLAETSTTLKMQLELKNELIEDRDRLRASLEASDDTMHRATLQVERYKQKLEEVTKECNFLRSGVDKSDHTFNNQRNMIRDLRTTNETLEASVKELKSRQEALEASVSKAREHEIELESCRKQLLQANQENEQLKQSTYQLTTVRRELETTSRELQSKTELENSYLENRVELDLALRQVEFTNRELKSRTQALETLQRESDAVSASARTLNAELSTTRTDLASTRAELKSSTDLLQSTKSSLESVVMQLTTSKEDAHTAKRELDIVTKELTGRNAAIEQFGKLRGDLEQRLLQLESEKRDLSTKVHSLELDKTAATSQVDRVSEMLERERNKGETKLEQLQERQTSLVQQLETAKGEAATHRRAYEDAQAKLTVSDKQIDALRSQVITAQQESATLKADLNMSSREVKHLEHEIHELQAYRGEADSLRAMVTELQRQLAQHGNDRQVSESRESVIKSHENTSLRKELDEMRLQVAETSRYKLQIENTERERVALQRDVTELKIENERLQSRVKTTQMDMELSQRQFQFNNLMMAGGLGAGMAGARPPPQPYPQYDSPSRERSDRLTNAMENITTLLREKELAVVQIASTQQALDSHVLQLAEEKHKNQAMHDVNVKLEAKVDKLQHKLEQTVAQHIADEQKLLNLRDEIGNLNTQLQIKAHDLILKTQDVERLTTTKDALELRLTEELKQLQDKWLQAQGELQNELRVNQTLTFQVEDARREKIAAEERLRNDLVYTQKALETARAETTSAQENLVQVKSQGVVDKEHVATLSSKVSDLTVRLGQAESRAELSTEEVNRLTTANVGLSAKLSAAAQQCKDWETQCETQHARADQLQSKWEQQTAKCDQLQAKLDALSKEIVQALSAVDSSARNFSATSTQSIEYLVANLVTEISKYQNIYTEVTTRRNDAATLVSNLEVLSKTEAAQKSQLQTITTELSVTTTQLLEARTQLTTLQQAHRDHESEIAALKSVNSELEYMCDTMAKELEAATKRAEELDHSKGEQRNDLTRQLETLRVDAEQRVQRELAPLERRVKELSDKLAASEQSTQSLQTESLQSRAEFVKAQQDIDSLTTAARSLYQLVSAPNAPGSPSKSKNNSVVPESHKMTSPSALLSAVETSLVEWSRALRDYQTNAEIQKEAITLKNKAIDELQARVQAGVVETQESLHNIFVEVDKASRAVTAVSQLSMSPSKSPSRSSPTRRPSNASRDRSLSFSSTAELTKDESASVLYQRIVRTLSALSTQYERNITAQTTECEKLRTQLAQKEAEMESAVSIQQSSLQLQRENEVFQLKQLQEQQHEEHAHQLELFKESVHVQHTEQITILQQTHEVKLVQHQQQLKQAQKALNRSLRERTVLQETLDQLREELKAREEEIEEVGAQSSSTQAYFEATQQRYQDQITQLETTVEQLRRAASIATPSAYSAAKKEIFYFEGEALSSDQVREKLQELTQYRDYTEQKILDFEHLIMNTFYHKTEDGTGRRFKSPQQALFEAEEEEEEDRARHLRRSSHGSAQGQGASRGEDQYHMEPTSPGSPVWRSHTTEPQSARVRRLSSGSGTLSTPGQSATGGLLSGMLMDFHQVLKEHRRLKRLCSSQQVCIMALRLVMKETEAVVVHTEHKEYKRK